jgi:hypothetical protein
MKVEINKNDVLPEGEYELTDRNKLENAKGNVNSFASPASDRQILIEYDRIAGRIMKNGKALSPQSLFNLEKNRPIEKYSDEELQTVIRRAENTEISGSLYQRANNEWKLRQDQKILDATKRKKWASDNVPTGYPKNCSSDQIREVIQDLSDEKYHKLQGGRVNITWKRIIDGHIKSGERELGERREVRHWYEKPLGITFLGVVVLIIGFLFTNILLAYFKKDTYIGSYVVPGLTNKYRSTIPMTQIMIMSVVKIVICRVVNHTSVRKL